MGEKIFLNERLAVDNSHTQTGAIWFLAPIYSSIKGGEVMDLFLKERVIFVTGGSRGIGKSIVEDLLKEGVCIGTCARNMSELEQLRDSLSESMRSRLNIQQCDVRNPDDVRTAVNLTIEQFGHLDGIVTNAGFGTSGRVLETTINDWMSQYEIKIISILNVVHAAIPALRQSNAGRVVIMNGVTANVPDSEMAAVSASRAAVKQVVNMLAEDLAVDNICVNVVNIGVIDTNRQIERFKKSGSVLTYSDWAKQEAERRGIILGRFGRADEVSPIVMLLLSPLSSYITASSIDVAGGLNAR